MLSLNEIKGMQPKQFMRQVLIAEREIKTIKARIAHYEDLGLSITAFKTDTPVTASRGSSRVEMAAVGVVDSLSALNANLGAYVAITDYAEKLINQIPQERYRQILSLRYLAGLSMRSVSDEVGYTDRNSIYRAHGWALAELGKVMRRVNTK